MKIIGRTYIFSSFRREVIVHQNGLATLFFIDAIVPSQKSVRSCIYLLVIAISEHSECVIFALFLLYYWLYRITGFPMVLNLCMLRDKLQRVHNIAARLITRTKKGGSYHTRTDPLTLAYKLILCVF